MRVFVALIEGGVGAELGIDHIGFSIEHVALGIGSRFDDQLLHVTGVARQEDFLFLGGFDDPEDLILACSVGFGDLLFDFLVG